MGGISAARNSGRMLCRADHGGDCIYPLWVAVDGRNQMEVIASCGNKIFSSTQSNFLKSFETIRDEGWTTDQKSADSILDELG